MASVFRPAYTRLDRATGQRVPGKSPTWWVQYRGPDGRHVRQRGYADRAATLELARHLERRAARQAVGLVDDVEEACARPLSEHLDDFERDLATRGSTTKYVALLVGRARRLLKAARVASLGELRGATVGAALARFQKAGLGPQTRNFYLQAVASFCRWLVRERRLPSDPLAHLRPVNVRTDRRHDRRAISADELRRLFAAAAEGKPFRGLRGVDRAMLYEVAALTGLRVAELASLTPASFDLAATPPTVTVEAGYSKRRRRDVLPLHPDLARKLAPWLAERPATAPLWPGTWWERASRMVKRDIAVAGLPYRDASGGVFDFHALRHQFLSTLARSGVHPKVAQKLARHSTITLTMDRYSHLDLAELGDALRLVPSPADVRE